MPERLDALTKLMQQHVGTHRGSRLSVVAFAERAIDPSSKYQPSKTLIGDLIQGKTPKMTPELISALAVGLEMPRDVVAAAAHLQVLGYEEHELEGAAQVRLLREIGTDGDTPKAQAVANRWAEDDATE